MNGIADLYRLTEVEAGTPAPMMVFPVGDWTSAKYPRLSLSQELANEVIANFTADVMRTRVPVDLNHDPKSPANGWVDRLYMAPFEWNGISGEALFADWTPNERGAQLVNDGEYAYDSLEIAAHKDPVTGTQYDNVLKAISLTNRPVLRMMPSVLEAGEAVKLAEPVEIALSEITLAETKSEGDAGDFPAAAYAYVPDASKPSTWKLRLWATPGGGPDAAIVGAAVAALGKGFRGQKVEIPAADLAAVKARVRAAWQKANPDKEADDMPVVIKASEEEEDPVASLLADLEAVLDKAGTTLRGKPGVRAIRTYLRETLSKASAHKLGEAGSSNDLRDAIQAAVSARFGALMGEGGYVTDFGPDWVIWSTWQEGADRNWRASWQQTEQGITLGDPVEVKRETTYVPVSDSSPAGAQSAGSTALSDDPKAAEGHGAPLAEGDAARKGADHMNPKIAKALKLAEDADDAAVEAAVVKLTEERDTATAKVAEVEKAKRAGEVEAELAEIEKLGNLTPGEKPEFLTLAEEQPDVYAARVAERKALPEGTKIKLGEVGTSQGSANAEVTADVELAEKAKARAAKDGIGIGKAQKLTLAEDPDLAQRIHIERYGKEA